MKNLKKLALTTTAVIAFVFSISAQKNYLKDADTLQCPDTLTFNLVTAVQPVLRKVSIKGGELNMYIPNTNGTLNMLPNTNKTYKNFSYTGVV